MFPVFIRVQKTEGGLDGIRWPTCSNRGKIIEAYDEVYGALGYGFTEKVYENALAIELKESGLRVETQKYLPVYYRDQLVGEYIAEMVINESVLLELKAVRRLAEDHEAQLLNYLKATIIEVGLLLNFGPEPRFKRRVYDNERKGSLTWSKPA